MYDPWPVRRLYLMVDRRLHFVKTFLSLPLAVVYDVNRILP